MCNNLPRSALFSTVSSERSFVFQKCMNSVWLKWKHRLICENNREMINFFSFSLLSLQIDTLYAALYGFSFRFMQQVHSCTWPSDNASYSYILYSCSKNNIYEQPSAVVCVIINERYNLIVFNLHHMANYHRPDLVLYNKRKKNESVL